MKFQTFLLSAAAAASLAIASPVAQTIPPPPAPVFFYEPITLTFSGGPASYTLNIAADGSSYQTNNDLSISLITSPGFDAYNNCNFYTATGGGPYSSTTKFTPSSNGSISVGPPQPISSVSCKPIPGGSNTCLPVYADCEWCGGGFGGCQVLNCCSGYCAATKCRCTTPGGCF